MVFVSKCLSERQCSIAVKKYDFTSKDLKDYFLKEATAYEFLMKKPYRNIVAYYGGYIIGNEGALALELCDLSFEDFLSQKKSTLSIGEFNEICFQLLGLNAYFLDVGFVPLDGGFRNMVFSKHDRAVKLIDLEKYAMRSESLEFFDKNMEDFLNGTGVELLLLQLEMKCRDEKINPSGRVNYFFDSYCKSEEDPFGENEFKRMLHDEKLWHHSLQEPTRQAIALCFIKDRKGDYGQLSPLAFRHLIQNRQDLIY